MILTLAAMTASAQDDFNPTLPGEPNALYKVTVGISDKAAGTVSGGGSYAEGTNITIRRNDTGFNASATVYYRFKCWMLNGEEYAQAGTSSSFTYTVGKQNASFVAVYEAKNPDDVSSKVFLVAEPKDACTFNRTSGSRYMEGNSISIYCNTASSSFKFDGWYDGDELISLSSSFYYTIGKDDATLTARFTYEPMMPGDPSGNQEDVDNTPHINNIFFNEARQWPGKKITMPLMMDNTDKIAAMQFDLVLPEGITLDKNAKGKYALKFNADTERTDASIHTLSSSLQSDGSIRVLCYSTDKEPFEGNSGALIDFPLTIAETVEPGEYSIVLKNIILTATDKKEYKEDEVVCKLIVPDYEMGDVNGDKMVNVTDIVYIADYILGNADPAFNELAADMNEDGVINVTDIVFISDKILEIDNGTVDPAAAKAAIIRVNKMDKTIK